MSFQNPLTRKMPLLQNKTGSGIVFLAVFLISSFRVRNPVQDSTLIIRFRVYVHGEPLQLNKKYKNPFGEQFEISLFRFYIGKISLVYCRWKQENSNGYESYHLVDLSDSSSTSFEIRVAGRQVPGTAVPAGRRFHGSEPGRSNRRTGSKKRNVLDMEQRVSEF